MNLSSLADLTQVLTYLKQVTETSSLNRFTNEKYKELQAKQKELEQLFIIEVLKVSAESIDREGKIDIKFDVTGSFKEPLALLKERQKLATEGGTVTNTLFDEIINQAKLNNSVELTQEEIDTEREKMLSEKSEFIQDGLEKVLTPEKIIDPEKLTTISNQTNKKKNPKVKRKSTNEE